MVLIGLPGSGKSNLKHRLKELVVDSPGIDPLKLDREFYQSLGTHFIVVLKGFGSGADPIRDYAIVRGAFGAMLTETNHSIWVNGSWNPFERANAYAKSVLSDSALETFNQILERVGSV